MPTTSSFSFWPIFFFFDMKKKCTNVRTVLYPKTIILRGRKPRGGFWNPWRFLYILVGMYIRLAHKYYNIEKTHTYLKPFQNDLYTCHSDSILKNVYKTFNPTTFCFHTTFRMVNMKNIWRFCGISIIKIQKVCYNFNKINNCAIMPNP